MNLETFLMWMVVGLIVGWLAAQALGGGYGLAGDIIAGLAGSLFGSLIFRTLYLEAPFGGIVGTIFVAFVGAAVSLTILRLVRSSGIAGARRHRLVPRRRGLWSRRVASSRFVTRA